MAVHRQPEGRDVDLLRNACPVPPHVEPIVGREYRLIEHFERRFQQRRPRALQDERPLLGKGCRDQSFVRAARQRQPDRAVGKRRQRGERKRGRTRGAEKLSAGCERLRVSSQERRSHHCFPRLGTTIF